jgi:hypothetical protein
MPDEPDHKTLLDRLVGSLKWGTVGTVVGGLGAVGLGSIARKGTFGKAFREYAERKFPLFPTPSIQHAILGAGVGSKAGAATGLIIGRKPKDTKELSAVLDDLIEFEWGDRIINELKRSKIPMGKKLIQGALLRRTVEANRLWAARKMVRNPGNKKEAQALFAILPDKASRISTRQLVLQHEALRRHNLLSAKLDDLIQFAWGDRFVSKVKDSTRQTVLNKLWDRTMRSNELRKTKAMVLNPGNSEQANALKVILAARHSHISEDQYKRIRMALRRHNLSAKLNNLIQFKTLYQPGQRDEPQETIPKLEGVVDYTVQRHAAKRAGLHRDVRIGTPSHGLYSWATRKDLPAEGGKIAIHPQPVHPHSYLGWEGNIPEGYGAGDVSTEHIGKALVTHSTPEEVHATLADQKEHHRLAFVKTPKGWLMTRGKSPEPPKEAAKPEYKSVGPDKAHEALGSLEEGSIVQPKVDGALVYVTTRGNRPEVFSHRKGKQSGRNIIHTERVFHGRPTTDIPKEHQRTLLGELYGTKGGKAIEPQELGGILNTHLGESIAKQKARGVKLKIMPFDYANGKGETYPERLAKVKETLQYLPSDKFHAPEEATGTEQSKELFENIRKGKHPLTKEGVIVHPPKGKMIKIKNTEEANVEVTGTYPGTGKFKGSHGGFTYEGGRVGTGFSDETRRSLHESIGRIARIRHQGRYPSGAYRAPSFIAIEENK